MFGGLGKTGDNGDDEAPTDSGRRQRRRSSIRVQAFFCSLRRLCDGLQQQARQTTSATRSGSKSDIARSKSTENLVAESEEGCGDSKSVHSVCRARSRRWTRVFLSSGELVLLLCRRRQADTLLTLARTGNV